MVTVKTVLKILAVTLFVSVLVMFSLSAAKIYKGRKNIENILGSSVSYFSDEPLLSRGYYKFKDENAVEYWVEASSGELVYIYDKSAAQLNTSTGQSTALDKAYEAAEKWNSSFFSSDTTWIAVDNTYYTFYIMQFDDNGYKNGKFIEVAVSADQIESISMHTAAVKSLEFKPCINQSKAIDIAYQNSESSEFALYKKNNHLVKTGFYKSGETWIWDVSIWKITADEIEAMETAIDEDVFYNCQMDAVTGEVLDAKWIMQATDYCPLTGEILSGD